MWNILLSIFHMSFRNWKGVMHVPVTSNSTMWNILKLETVFIGLLPTLWYCLTHLCVSCFIYLKPDNTWNWDLLLLSTDQFCFRVFPQINFYSSLNKLAFKGFLSFWTNKISREAEAIIPHWDIFLLCCYDKSQVRYELTSPRYNWYQYRT